MKRRKKLLPTVAPVQFETNRFDGQAGFRRSRVRRREAPASRREQNRDEIATIEASQARAGSPGADFRTEFKAGKQEGPTQPSWGAAGKSEHDIIPVRYVG